MSVLDSHCGRQVGAWAAAQGVAVDFTEYLTACGAFTCAPGLTPHCAQSPGCPDAESAPRAGAAVASFLPLPPPLPPEPDRGENASASFAANQPEALRCCVPALSIEMMSNMKCLMAGHLATALQHLSHRMVPPRSQLACHIGRARPGVRRRPCPGGTRI